MLNKELIDKIRQFKEENNRTLYELSRKINIQVATIERWFKTNRINRVYADLVKERLRIG